MARDLLGHENVEIGIKDDGVWTVFYTRTCSRLDPVTSKCTVHGTEIQPDICRDYSSHQCWYRRVFSTTLSAGMIRLNRRRLDRILTSVTFDHQDCIDRVPDWDWIMRELAEIPLELDAVELAAAAPQSAPPSPRPVGVERETRLVFPPGKPRKLSHFDLMRFRLGFPGVSLGISNGGWYFVVDAPAREETTHMSEYHLPEPDSDSLVIVNSGELSILRDLCTIDETGTIVIYPEPSAVRAAIAVPSGVARPQV